MSLAPDVTQPQFLHILSDNTVRWYRDSYADMLDDPDTSSPTIRTTYAIFNAEVTRRIPQSFVMERKDA